MKFSNVKENFVVPFVVGGGTIALVKYLAENVNPALAAIFGGLPIGLISSHFITNNKKFNSYIKNYFWVTLILLSSVILVNVLFRKAKLSKSLSFWIALGFWVGVVTLKVVLNKEY
tara:strand:+ start:120 stop:467 length:348 start_codon:yes stop_codon:yes gene_type:complete